jgi:hypothetical protein
VCPSEHVIACDRVEVFRLALTAKPADGFLEWTERETETMETTNTDLLLDPQLDLAGLYLDLAEARVDEAQRELSCQLRSVTIAQGAERMVEAAACLREVRARLAGEDDPREHFEDLADQLVARAAELAWSADLLSAGQERR